jgi:hypothetical protein
VSTAAVEPAEVALGDAAEAKAIPITQTAPVRAIWIFEFMMFYS